MREATWFAPAKVNLTLHVTGQRGDGYHLLDSLVVFADIGDTITVTQADDMSLTIGGPFAKGVPNDARNLMIKAAALLGVGGAAMHLEKNLPHPAGIGGGSSDAATTLHLLSALWNRPLPSIEQTLSLGADVPVCLSHQPQHMAGIGEVLTPVLSLPECAILLVNPCIDVPTGAVFQGLASKTNAAMTVMPSEPDFGSFIEWLQSERNDLEPPACTLAPVINDVLNALRANPKIALARMSGSGATCFGLCATLDDAQSAADEIATQNPSWWVRAAGVL